MVIERVQHFQPGQHAVVAVELAARGLGVDVAAGGHGGQVVLGAGAAREEVADGVAPQGAPKFSGPGGEELAALAVQVGQGDAAHPPARRRTDGGQRHEALPQAGAVDAQMVQDLCGLEAGWVHGGVLAAERSLWRAARGPACDQVCPAGERGP